MFNRFDRIKVMADLNDIIINGNQFSKKYDPSMKTIITEEYCSVGLRIKVDYIIKKVYIDFSSKILGDDYINKINILNIKDVYKRLNNIIQIPPMKFYRLSPIYCEVASDVKVNNVPDTIEALYIVSKFQSSYRSSPKLYKHDNASTSFYLKKNVITSEANEYLSIYCKYNELFSSRKNENLTFLMGLSEGHLNEFRAYFRDVVRIESKYASKSKIRACFGLNNGYNLYELLTSKINVNETIMNKIYDERILKYEKFENITYKQLDKINTLKLFNNDLEKIYELHRVMGSKVQKSKMLKPYRQLLSELMKQQENEKLLIIKEVKDKVKW